MQVVADILMVAGALAAGFYCYVLSRRLSAFKDAEGGIGQAVASLSAQVDELTRSVAEARSASETSASSLEELTVRAEGAAQRLELMVASMHDLPDVETVQPKPDQPVFSSRMSRAAG